MAWRETATEITGAHYNKLDHDLKLSRSLASKRRRRVEELERQVAELRLQQAEHIYPKKHHSSLNHEAIFAQASYSDEPATILFRTTEQREYFDCRMEILDEERLCPPPDLRRGGPRPRAMRS